MTGAGVASGWAPQGLRRLLLAQFLQGLGDNATLALMLAWLVQAGWDSWWGAALKWSFTVAYVVMAPWLLIWIDKGDKSRLLSAVSGLKVLAMAVLLLGAPPWAGFALLGLAAALYAPAKYGWVTQQVAPHQLIKATGWLEGSMVVSIMLGLALAGMWIQMDSADPTTHLRLGLIACTAIYLTSALLHLTLPLSIQNTPKEPTQGALRQWATDASALWQDTSVRVALLMTSLLWGMAAILQFVILDWSQSHLNMNLGNSFFLQTLVGLGIVMGAVLASSRSLHHTHRLWPLTWVMAAGLVLLSMTHHWLLGAILLLLAGVCAGWMMVPFNALLQHRGQRIRSAGRCMVVQGASENLSVLVMLGIYPWLREPLPNVNVLLWGMAALMVVTAHGLVGSRSWPRWPR